MEAGGNFVPIDIKNSRWDPTGFEILVNYLNSLDCATTHISDRVSLVGSRIRIV